jgi:methionyl-tRNA formyltransferase
MRLILCGKNNAAIECLDFLIERGDEVWAVGVAGDDGKDGWQRSLRAAAERKGVRFEQPRRINDPAFVQRLAEFRADALVSIQYDQILRDVLFDHVGCPCLNLHFALLPRHPLPPRLRRRWCVSGISCGASATAPRCPG